ncbi:MAG: GNAT family N-acetyltransferase [Anaerolineales bacterium]|nr:GNAT family N-acetyltransferase [Anaerolineales bacterium]
MPGFGLRPLTPNDRDLVRQKTIASWGSAIVVARGEVLRPAELPGFLAESEGEPIGLLTYVVRAQSCEIVTLDSWREGSGIGSALVQAAKQAAIQAGCRRLWLVTTNNNTSALHFYQKRGFVLCALRVEAIAASRRLKPEIPLTDAEGIPIRDEIELEMLL